MFLIFLCFCNNILEHFLFKLNQLEWKILQWRFNHGLCRYLLAKSLLSEILGRSNAFLLTPFSRSSETERCAFQQWWFKNTKLTVHNFQPIFNLFWWVSFDYDFVLNFNKCFHFCNLSTCESAKCSSHNQKMFHIIRWKHTGCNYYILLYPASFGLRFY